MSRKFKNELYSLVDDEFISSFKGQQLDFMKKEYYKFYCHFCELINRKPLSFEEFYTNMHYRRMQLYQLCCPFCGYMIVLHRKKKKSEGFNYCANCGRGSVVYNIMTQLNRFIRLRGIHEMGLKEYKIEKPNTDDWLLGYDCNQMEIIELASIIEVIFRDYFEALVFINSLGIDDTFIEKAISKYTNNDFELSTLTLDDIIYGFNIFLNSRFEEIYTKIATFIYIGIESAGKYIAIDFIIKNKRKSQNSLKELYNKKKTKFDKLSLNKEISYNNIQLLDKLYKDEI